MERSPPVVLISPPSSSVGSETFSTIPLSNLSEWWVSKGRWRAEQGVLSVGGVSEKRKNRVAEVERLLVRGEFGEKSKE